MFSFFKKTESIYVAGWEVHLNGDQQCDNFIATQITTPSIAKSVYIGLELVFENGKLSKAYKYEDGTKEERPLEKDERGMALPKYQPNKLLEMAETREGLHQLGGELPAGFKHPEHDCVAPFQYLGAIDNRDEYFNWLPFKLHLTCPIYLNIGNVFLDYSNELRPTIINREEVERADTSYDDLNRDSEIVYNEVRFDFIEGEDFPGSVHAGLPNWIQYPEIPMCPKSGKRMRFVCQLNGGVSTKRTNVKPKKEFYNRYFQEMNFWGDGDLFVFFEPSSKVACYFIQNT